MHLFDIRRSNSVTELWKRFENTASPAPKAVGAMNGVSTTAEPTASNAKPEDAPASQYTIPPMSAPGEDSQPLMAAFEAELANILKSSETSDTQAQGARSEPATETAANTSSQRIPPAVEQFVAQILQQVCSGADVMQTELRARIPELRRQLSDAQRGLPENLATSLQALFAQLEAQMRSALNNLPDSGRHMAEEAIQAGRPVAEDAVERLRSFATDLDQTTRTLFAAFESEFGRAGSENTSTTTGSSNAAPGVFCPPPSNVPMPPVPTYQESQAQPVDTTTQQKDTTATGQSTVKDPEPSGPSTSQRAGPNLHVEQEPRPWERLPPRPPPHWRPPPINSTLPPSYLHPLSHPGSRASFNPGQPWHQFGPSPGSLPHHFDPFAPPRPPPPPPPPPGPFSFPQWSQLRSVAPFFPDDIPQPKDGEGFLQLRTPPALPYTAGVEQNGGMQTEAPGNKTLFIGNVGFNVTEKMIQDVFASKGFIVNVDLPLDFTSGKHAGFGYLHFPSIHPAMAAMNALQGFHIDGHAINLEFSDQMPIERIPSLQPSEEHASSGSLNAQQGSSRAASVSDASAFLEKPSEKQQILPKDAARKSSSGSIKRRKSVTFQETDFSAPGVASPSPNAPRAASPALIDLTDEVTADIPPVGTQCHSQPLNRLPMTQREMTDLGMDRFPPVSQLDAHLMANQRQGRAYVPPHGVSPEDYAFFRNRVSSRPGLKASPKSVALGTNIQETQTPSNVACDSGTEKFEKKDDMENSRGGSKPIRTIKRSGTVHTRPLNDAPPRHFTAGDPLRRRATERNSLRSSARQSAEMDTWARLDRRERLRSRPSSTRGIPGSFPIEEASQPPVTNASPNNTDGAQDTHTRDIENCISSLVYMGYGTPQEGGRARMAVYAAASNGSLLDAIEMIEEERKAYAGRL